MGTDILFENHTIKEIQEIEKKLRNDIERKKEELRQMVGERYRDLMEAADTITEMKEIAESVTGCVRSIEKSCSQLQNSSLQNGIMNSIQTGVARKKKTNELLYTVASQIKILMDSPTKIWSSIERKDFVCAVSLYLLARHTHSLLLLDPTYRLKNVSMLFPIVNRQWTSVSHFRHVLLQNCQTALETQDTEPEDAVGPLCCSCLLSNTSLQKIFLEVLHIRKNVLKSIFRPEKSAKSQICEFVTCVQMTLKMIYALFYSDNETTDDGYKTNLLHQTLENLISKEAPVTLLDLTESATYKFLPSEVTDFRPILASALDPCNSELLQSNCNEWLNDITLNLVPELRSLLNFVKSVQSLALIREAVCDKLCEMKHWDRMCNNLLKRKFSIWDSFLKECFWERIKDIINEQVKSATEFCQKDIEETLSKIGLETEDSGLEVEKNISLYVWMESPGDVMDNIAWHPRHHRNYWDNGELSMKAMGFTTRNQSICRDLDCRLQRVLEDISHFSCLHQERGRKVAEHLSRDANDIYKYLAEAAGRHLFDLSSYVETTLLYLERENDTFENNYRIVFLSHLCSGMANLCPHINVCLSSDKLSEKCLRQGTNTTFANFKENDLWKDLKKKLLNLNSSAFRLWSKSQILQVLKSVDSGLVTSSAEGLLRALLQWDKVEIQEESEQGNAVNSVLRIPQCVSTPISNALFAFCCKLNAIGGFATSSDVRADISQQLLIGLLDVYKRKLLASEELNPRLLQVQSLQFLFDVQFLVGLLAHKGSTCDNITHTSQDIISQATSHVDPFDMDVFSIPLQQSVRRALQKSLSLFGLLTSPDQVGHLTRSHPQLSGQMEHNILLSSSPGSRFPLLPLSSKSSHFPQKELEVKSMSSHSSSPNLSAHDHDIPAISMKSATSFYDRVTAMSSSWFGN